jgi:hypothetical protein
VFTLNNYTPQEEVTIKEWAECKAKYAVIGKEEGKSGTPHLQGYVELKRRQASANVRRAMPRAHIESRRGTAKQAADYCKKDGDFWETGSISQQGRRNDIAKLVDDCKNTELSTYEVFERNPVSFFKFNKHASTVMNMVMRQDTSFTNMKVYILWGAAGTGKTRAAHDLDPEIFVLPCGGGQSTLWWDGYDPRTHKTVLFDDFYGGAIKYPYLLKLLDGYRFNLPVKGSFAWKSYDTVVITSNNDPESWYPNGLSPALRRRITSIHEYHEDGTVEPPFEPNPAAAVVDEAASVAGASPVRPEHDEDDQREADAAEEAFVCYGSPSYGSAADEFISTQPME